MGLVRKAHARGPRGRTAWEWMGISYLQTPAAEGDAPSEVVGVHLGPAAGQEPAGLKPWAMSTWARSLVLAGPQKSQGHRKWGRGRLNGTHPSEPQASVLGVQRPWGQGARGVPGQRRESWFG